MELSEILQVVKNEMRDRMLRVQVGWESLFSIPTDCIMITSTDLKYTYVPRFLALLEQIVVISRFNVAVVVKASEGTKGLLDFLQNYNHDYPRQQVKKVLAADGSLIANLLKQWEIQYQQRRQRHMPPPDVWDPDGELEGVEPDRAEGKVKELLQGSDRLFRHGGYVEPPISYSLPNVFFYVDGKNRVQSNRFVITPHSEETALLLYIALADYHWGSGDGSEVILVKLWNPGLQPFFLDPRYRPLLGAVASMTPEAFLNFIGKRREYQASCA